MLLSEWRTNCQACFCQLDLIVVELWSFSTDPFNGEALNTYAFPFLPSPTLLCTFVFFSPSPPECCILLSALCFSLFSCIAVAPHENFVAASVCLFFFFFDSRQFCCFTSVKSAPDVHIIPYNALVINHGSLAHQPRCRHTIWPNKWPTYDVRYPNMKSKRLCAHVRRRTQYDNIGITFLYKYNKHLLIFCLLL